jgi:glycosyltransferase involved in cell wall biosynthesis
MQQPVYSIAQVTDQLNVGGAEQIIVMLANLLQAHGHSTAVVTTVAPGSLANKLHSGVQLINLNRQLKWNPVTMYRLVKVIEQFDVVHVHSSYNLRYVYLARVLFFLRKPIFYHEHYGNAINTIPNTLQKYIYAQTMFIAVSHRLAEWAKNSIGLPERNISVLQNTIIKCSVDKKYPHNDTISICIVGNILPNKNLLFALKLLQALQQGRKEPVHLTIIGNIADEQYYEQLSAFINKNNLQQSIAFVHDFSNVQSILSQFTVALHCSFSESGPLVLVEYLAQGLPFVTYNTGEVVQQLQSHLSSLIMQDFDIEKWMQAIKHAIALPREELAAHFDSLYNTYFSPQAYYCNCIEIYKEGLLRKP